MRSALLLLPALGLAGLASACATVEPWQRGDLAKPQMALDPHPRRSALVAHIRAAREAASGSVAKDGGGCGCE